LKNFFLDKWFLDFISDSGELMIFYAAKLTWYGVSVSYSSWLSYNPDSGVQFKSRLGKLQLPVTNNGKIIWEDKKFGISGTWESKGKSIQARILESGEGYLNWQCHQPNSKVTLKIGALNFEGKGYAEQLTLTVLPWKVPMDELRWGHYCSDKNDLVWIEMRDEGRRQWVWMNGEEIKDCLIEDNYLSMPEKGIFLNLDRIAVLESEKKIYSVVGNLVRYLPGLNKAVPYQFLMADEFKWLNRGTLQEKSGNLSHGMAVNERVNFKTHEAGN